MKKALWEILKYGHVPQDSTVWCGMDPTGINCTADIKIASLEADPAAKRSLAGIILYILAYLHKLARQDPQATGVANSIWQSLRVDYTKEGKVGSNELPDVVCDELFTHIDILLDSSSTLHLHWGSGNAYLQLWFIDRIMQRGTLWIGRYQRVRDTSKLPNTQSSSSKGKEPDRESNRKYEISNDPEGSASAVSTQMNSGSTESILQRQGTRRMFARLADRALFGSDSKEQHPFWRTWVVCITSPMLRIVVPGMPRRTRLAHEISYRSSTLMGLALWQVHLTLSGRRCQTLLSEV